MKIYEIPFIIEVRAEDREDAENEASDIADALEATDWADRFGSVTAVITRDHNLLERLGINVDGEESE